MWAVLLLCDLAVLCFRARARPFSRSFLDSRSPEQWAVVTDEDTSNVTIAGACVSAVRAAMDEATVHRPPNAWAPNLDLPRHSFHVSSLATSCGRTECSRTECKDVASRRARSASGV